MIDKPIKSLISIIIPTYNSETSIKECLLSVLNQSVDNYEILIIDNVSSDETIRIASDFNDNKINIVSQKDKGVYDAMNTGIQLSKGEWLYFLGSDDILKDNDVLYDINNYIKLSDSNFIYGNAYFKNSGYIYGEESSIERLLIEGNICHQAIFYHYSIFSLVGLYNLKYPIWADWDFNIKCFKFSAIKTEYVNRIIAVYNDYKGISRDDDEVFKKQLPNFYIQEIDRLNIEIGTLNKKLNSFPYNIVEFVKKPFIKRR
ncbi:glycosyl transferase, family 2 [Arcticibacter svalbardensis MN12-7]|uniref:Glycosyl transferase, family 2 n=2 Tax=Arcticibacter TaxID=1288026 RepID=R9GQI5_9SPHI|nr:glycosyl transferase, family 2 [Arcticibacter svalbardensis MN12-7]